MTRRCMSRNFQQRRSSYINGSSPIHSMLIEKRYSPWTRRFSTRQAWSSCHIDGLAREARIRLDLLRLGVHEMTCLTVEVKTNQPNGQATTAVWRVVMLFLHLLKSLVCGFVHFPFDDIKLKYGLDIVFLQVWRLFQENTGMPRGKTPYTGYIKEVIRWTKNLARTAIRDRST